MRRRANHKKRGPQECAVMSLALRRTRWLDGTILPDDYDVTHDDEIVGCIYGMDAQARTNAHYAAAAQGPVWPKY